MNSKVVICGINTSTLPRLNEKQTNELLTKIKQGSEAAREEFIVSNMRLVLSVIKRFHLKNANSDDVFQAGCIGLIKAIDNFDLGFGVKFSTYAVPMIIGEIRRYLRDNNSIRVSRSLRDTAYKALVAKEKIMREKGHEPTIAEIAKEIGIKKEDVVFALDAIADPISLYEPVYNDGTDAIFVMDQLSDEKNTDEDWIEHISLREAIKKLHERERHILNLRFFKGRTQMEVSKELGISQAQVSRLEKSALEHMKKYI